MCATPVFGNVGTIVSFRVGPFDAEVLETIYAPKFYAVDLCNLGFAQVYLTLMIDGIGSAPFSAVTLPPIEHTGSSCKDMIIHSSREQFAFRRGIVEETINRWHGLDMGEENPSANDGKPVADRRPPRPAPRAARDSHPAEKRINERKERGERSSSRDERGGGGSKPKPQTKDQQSIKPSPKTKNLNELRAVLRNMASDSGTIPIDSKKPAANNDKESIEKAKPKAPDLRQALSSVIKEEDSQPNKPNPDQEFNSEEVDLKGGLEHRELDPKQLERMMRVKSNDKTPIK